MEQQNGPKTEGNNIICSLTFSEANKIEQSAKPLKLRCIKCSLEYEFPKDQDDYLAHLYLIHRLIIADVDDIAELEEYLSYWIIAFEDHELEEYCTTMLLDQLPDGTPSKNERYYLLSDILPQDYELRKSLHSKRLEKALAQHQFERTDRTFSRECLYCRDVITGLRSEFVAHLFNKHFLQLGKSENLVYVDELLNTVQSNLENLVCLFCEKVFKDRATLKEHMRKKGHKRINPNIRLYDKFFLINYRSEKPKHVKTNRKDMPKKKTIIKTEKSEAVDDGIWNSGEDSDSDWSDWDDAKQWLNCLYCPEKDLDFAKLKEHMLSMHGVDFDSATSGLNFYQKIKVVNYVRRQVHITRCVTCNARSESLEKLLEHMQAEKHFGIGDKKCWDQPEFFFCTYEDDGVLCLLDDNTENDDVVIIPEENSANINKDAERLSLENFNLF